MSEPAAELLPHDEDAEKATLGAAMLSAEAAEHVTRRLRAEHFYLERHRTIFEAIAAVRARGIAADPVTVKDELRRSGGLSRIDGGALYVLHLAETVPTPASVQHYAAIVHRHARARRLIQGTQEAQRRIRGGEDPDGVAADLASVGRGDLDAAADLVRDTFGPEHVEEVGDGVPRLSVPAPELLERSQEGSVAWTVESLLTAEAVAVFGGEPKSLKSWAALDCALAVGTGVRALHAFEPVATGPVLVVQEESRSADYARRLRWLARGHDLDPERDTGGLHVASQRGLLIDEEAGRRRLVAEIEELAAALVVLDPLVRMHSADEDRAREMRAVLRFLRRLQAEHGCAVLVVHHMGKLRGDGPAIRAGQRLRGTGDLHALLDSGLYFLPRAGIGTVAVEVEHREAPPPEPFTIRLEADGEAESARLVAEAGTFADLAALEAMPEVEAALERAPDGLTQRRVEEAVSRRREVVREALRRLEDAGRAISTEEPRPDAAGRTRRQRVYRRTSG